MTRGIILADTLAHADFALLSALDFICMEPGLVEKGLGDPRLAGAELVPMISSFLGAKTLASKQAELEYAASLGARRALYFFDSLNLRRGWMDAFAAEIDQLRRWSERLEPIVFLPCSHFSEAELRSATDCLVESGLSVMLSVDGLTEAGREPFARLAAAFGQVEVYAAFPDRPRFEEGEPLLEGAGLRGLAYFG
jgi:hypothetical protein